MGEYFAIRAHPSVDCVYAAHDTWEHQGRRGPDALTITHRLTSAEARATAAALIAAADEIDARTAAGAA